MDVKTLCLSVLSLGPATGYEIKKRLEEGPYQHFVEASFGSIYPSLTRLAQEGLIDVRTEPLENRPDKKVYSLTSEGAAQFATELLATGEEDKFRSDFLFQMMFADRLTTDEILAKLDAKLMEYRWREADMAEKAKSMDMASGQGFCLGFGQALVAAAIAYMERYRTDLAERAAPVPARRSLAGGIQP